MRALGQDTYTMLRTVSTEIEILPKWQKTLDYNVKHKNSKTNLRYLHTLMTRSLSF